MPRYLVTEGDAMLLATTTLPPRDTYGADWIVVEAADEADALAQAAAYDANHHPAQVELELFAAAYRAGALDLPTA